MRKRELPLKLIPSADEFGLCRNPGALRIKHVNAQLTPHLLSMSNCLRA
jgi:hypothetical protein